MKLNKNAIDLLLARKRLTIREMASIAGISDRTYYRGIETEINPKQVGKLAAALGVDPEEIIVTKEVM